VCGLVSNPRARDTKAALRREARRLFAARGYGAVSIRDLSDAVGIRQGAVYNHFGSKQELLVELMTQHMDRLFGALDDAMTGVVDSAQQLEAFARFHVRHHIDYQEDVFLAYMELRSLEADGLNTILPLRDRYEARLSSILQQGVSDGVFRLYDVAVQTRAILAMLTGVTVWYREGGRLSREAVVEGYVQAVMQSVGLPYPAGVYDRCPNQ
jgi:AcrR family transcriptional regulator